MLGILRRRVHCQQRTVQRRNSTIKSLSEALAECRHRNILSETAEQSLLNSFSPIAKEIMLNEIRNLHTAKHGRRYSDNIKAFSLTVFYYSPRAYTFLRSLFCLPSVSSIRDYNSSVDSSPGFSHPVLSYLEKKGGEKTM